MSSRKFFFGLLFASIFGGLVALAVARMFEKEPVRYESVQQNNGVHFSSLLADSNFRVPEGLNFVYAAEMVTPLRGAHQVDLRGRLARLRLPQPL
jgi:serine protease Do